MRFRFRLSTDQDADLRGALVQAATGCDRTGCDQLYALVSDFYEGVLFVGYAADGIRRQARRLRKRRLRLAVLEPLILDAPVNGWEPGTTWGDRLAIQADPVAPAELRLCDIPTHPAVARAVNQLTARQQQVVFLVVCGGSSEAEAGELLGTSQQNINRVKQRALRRLQALLREEDCHVA